MNISQQKNEHLLDEWMQVQMTMKGDNLTNIFDIVLLNISSIVIKKNGKIENLLIHLLLEVYESYFLYI
jgi:hypothetical protein